MYWSESINRVSKRYRRHSCFLPQSSHNGWNPVDIETLVKQPCQNGKNGRKRNFLEKERFITDTDLKKFFAILFAMALNKKTNKPYWSTDSIFATSSVHCRNLYHETAFLSFSNTYASLIIRTSIGRRIRAQNYCLSCGSWTRNAMTFIFSWDVDVSRLHDCNHPTCPKAELEDKVFTVVALVQQSQQMQCREILNELTYPSKIQPKII